ncbi:putative helicase MOV-10 [Mytilus edulis]|uniref:putative helicase MOV-10 n=1 Tax=Mytilus edulis TaxID=6550 RepID=UPI0039EE9830
MKGNNFRLFNESKDRGLDFLRFLSTEQISIQNEEKEKIKNVYNSGYNAYRKQIKPDESQIPFPVIVKALFTMGKLHLRENRMFSGEAPLQYINSHQNRSPRHQNSAYQNLSAPKPSENSHRRNGKNHNIKTPPASVQQRGTENQNTESGAPKKRSRNRRFKRKFPGRVAVDQHLLINKESTSESDAESPGDDTSPNRNTNANTFKVSDFDLYTRKIGNIYECIACLAKCTSRDEIERHLEGKRHRLGVMTFELKKRRNELVQDQKGIQIISDVSCVDSTFCLTINEKVPKTIVLSIKNNSNDSCELIHCELLKRIRVFQLDDDHGVTESQTTMNILPGGTYKIRVKTSAKNVGTYHAPVAFHFHKYDDQEFHIIKFLSARCINDITENIKPSLPYKRQSRRALQRLTKEIVAGYPVPKLYGDNLKREIELKTYQIPSLTRLLVNKGLKDAKGLTQVQKVELTVIKSAIDKPVELGIYVKRFQNLMHFEEIQMEYDIRKYDLENVPMVFCSENSRLLKLEVPGLAENRPSVLRGDRLYVRINNNEHLGDKEYQGYVHEVRQLEVVLGFDDSLIQRFIVNMKFNVRFEFNRLPMKLQHRACELAIEEGLEHKILFPDRRTVCTEQTSHPVNVQLRYFCRAIEANEKQQIAVKHITLGTSRPSPYIVFGPPGTGKTFTIVEAIKQIWKTKPHTHILACTPSNSAADLIAERLLEHIPPRDILRLNAASRSYNTIPEKVKPVCNYSAATRQFVYHTKEDMMKYRIIISTLVTAGRLSSANFPTGHFSHVIVDEAGHAVEPELLIGVAGILNIDPHIPGGCGQLVLAGDPQQLGPILRSPFAIKYGLDKSLLERYMIDQEVYAKPYDERIITKLLNNYRSHPDILYLPNKLFYDDELVVMADQMMRESLCDWEKLPNKGFPIIFHGVIGQDMREARSPSFFNAEEVSVVHSYVNSLLKEKKRGLKINPKDIGIISPYRKQVQKLQQLMRSNTWADIQIGSVEEFQGQEKKIIIVSTVRSNPEYLSLDMDFKLGFLKNPKRFNVTLTRAKALLIVVGNPVTLSHDNNWKQFIKYCQNNKAYVGVDFEDEETMVEDIIDRLSALGLSDPKPQGSEPEEAVISVEDYSRFNDQPWRSDL